MSEQPGLPTIRLCKIQRVSQEALEINSLDLTSSGETSEQALKNMKELLKLSRGVKL